MTFDAGNPAFLRRFRAAQYFHRVGEEFEDYAFFHCVLDFFVTCRKFFLRSSVNHGYVCAQTFCAARRVHSHVAAADDNDFLVLFDRSVAVRLVGFHKVGSGQKFVCAVNAVEVFARDIHKFREACAAADKHAFEAVFVHKLVDGQNFADNHVGFDVDAQIF